MSDLIFDSKTNDILQRLGFDGGHGNKNLGKSLISFGTIANYKGLVVLTKTIGMEGDTPRYVVKNLGEDISDKLWKVIADRASNHGSECGFVEGGDLVDSTGDVITPDTPLYELIRLFEMDCSSEEEFEMHMGINSSDEYQEMTGDELLNAILEAIYED